MSKEYVDCPRCRTRIITGDLLDNRFCNECGYKFNFSVDEIIEESGDALDD